MPRGGSPRSAGERLVAPDADNTYCECGLYVPPRDGADNPYEAIKVIEAWDLDFHLGNAVKYIMRAGRKDPSKSAEDLRKARCPRDRTA